MARKNHRGRKAIRRTDPRPNRDWWEIKRILLPLGFALFALMVSSHLTYTHSFQSQVLGDEDRVEEEQQKEEEQREEEKKQEEEQKREEEKQSESNSGSGNTSGASERKETEVTTSEGVKVKTKIEDDGSRKVEVESDGVRFKFEEQEGEVKLKVENEAGEEIRTRDRLREAQELEDELEDDEVEIASRDGEMEIEHNAVRARVNFPLSIDPLTRQLTVTTPAGIKTVAVLPDAALVRLLASGLLSDIASGSTEPQVATDSAATSGSFELTLEGNHLVYEVHGTKQHRLFGFIPVTTPRTVTVSALTGDIVSQTQTWLSGFVDLLSL